MVGGAKGAGRNHRRAIAGAAGDVVHMGDVEGFGQAHLREDGGKAARLDRFPRARRTQEDDAGVGTPASASALPLPRLKMPASYSMI
jgi:hypothetical protein